MGFYLYRALRSEGRERKKLFIAAYFIPFLVHGLWDFALDITGFMIDKDALSIQIAGIILMIAMVIAMLVAVIKGATNIRRIDTNNINAYTSKSSG